MGVNNNIVIPFYKSHIRPVGNVALLGSSDNSMFDGELYDLSLGNWEINSEWELPRKYDTIICTRCAYFAKDINQFMRRCYEHLEDGGRLYVDWGLGDHWRFKDFKVGWVKDGVTEYAYGDTNYLWSTIWDDNFMVNEKVKEFEENIKKFGYVDLRQAIINEVPVIFDPNIVSNMFDYEIEFLSISKPYAQLYMLFSGCKRG